MPFFHSANDAWEIIKWSGSGSSSGMENSFTINITMWRAVYAPGDGQTSPAYSIRSVQYLYINQLLPANKSVL
jgi:hypothetical protein